MKVTSVTIHPAKNENKARTRLLAYAEVIFDNALIVKGIRLIKGTNKIFVAMPNKENNRTCEKCKTKISFRHSFCPKCGEVVSAILTAVQYKDIIYPINKEFADEVEAAIITAYQDNGENKI